MTPGCQLRRIGFYRLSDKSTGFVLPVSLCDPIDHHYGPVLLPSHRWLQLSYWLSVLRSISTVLFQKPIARSSYFGTALAFQAGQRLMQGWRVSHTGKIKFFQTYILCQKSLKTKPKNTKHIITITTNLKFQFGTSEYAASSTAFIH